MIEEKKRFNRRLFYFLFLSFLLVVIMASTQMEGRKPRIIVTEKDRLPVTDSTTTTSTLESTTKSTTASVSLKTKPGTEDEELPEISNITRLRKIMVRRSLGDVNFKQRRAVEIGYTVPRKIIMLWIDSEMPEKYIKNVERLARLNPGYTVQVWLDHQTGSQRRDELKKAIISGVLELRSIESLELINYNLIEEGSIGAKADLLRYEIIYMEGGVYQDMDVVALKPFPSKIFQHSFVAYTTNGYDNICNGVFGFPKRSNFMKYVMSLAEENFERSSYVPAQTGPTFFTTAFLRFDDPNVYMIDQKYLIGPKSNISITYHTMDASWMI